MKNPVVGTFRQERDAVGAVRALQEAGWNTDDISVVGHKREAIHQVDTVTGTNSAEGMLAGGATGAFLGSTVGLLAAAGLLFIPAVGPLLAAGPIATVIAGAAVGGSTGTLIGGLAGLGIPRREADVYRTMVEQDHVLVIVKADADERAAISRIFREYGAVEPYSAALTLDQSLISGIGGDSSDDLHVFIGSKDDDEGRTTAKELVIPRESKEI